LVFIFFETNSESIPESIKAAWTDFISKNIKSFDFDMLTNSSTSVFALILPAIKDFATEVKLPYFNNEDSKDMLEIIKTFLEGNTVLTSLSIEVNNFRSKEEVAEFFRIIKNNKTLKSLNILYSFLRNEEIRILANFLAANDTLTELNIAYISYNKDSAKILLEAIQKNRSLKKLFISKSDKFKVDHPDDLKKLSSDVQKLEIIYLP